MANTAHLFRRQSSRDLNGSHRDYTKTLDELELKRLKEKLVRAESLGGRGPLYGATNQAFSSDDVLTTRHYKQPSLLEIFEEPQVTLPAADEQPQDSDIIADDAPGDERESWDSKITFLLATIGYAVGLGNVWRFPYLAQKNGGGAFLVPYFIMLFIQGLPIFFLELAIGQRLRKGAIGVWNEVSPYLGGIGISSAIVSFIVALYYNTIIAWCLIYFLHSFENPLPWHECPKRFITSNMTYYFEKECVVTNEDRNFNKFISKDSSPTQYYWYRSTLMVSPNVDEPESFNYPIGLSLVIAWTLIYLCMVQGITESGKVVYVTAIFPYVVLIIFFFRGITLDGATDGIAHLFTPRWDLLKDPNVWLEAGTQIFFSLGLAFGGLIAFSSYNPANNNCYRDALLVSFTNCGTSMFAGTVVFSIIGFKATQSYNSCLERNDKRMRLQLPDKPENCSLEAELSGSVSGTGLAFIIFTEAINQFPGAQIWAVLFFLMLFTLGIDSQFGTLEGVITSLVDMKLFPNLPKDKITMILCASCCILSLVFANGAGSYIFQLMDSFAGNYTLLIIAFFECIAVSYVYGLRRFSDDIELMTGSRPHIYWMLCWKYISPIAMLTILFASFMNLIVEGSHYPAWVAEIGATEEKDWPHWCIFVAVVLIGIAILWIPGVALCRLVGIRIVEDSDPAWFPSAELRDVNGIVPHEPTEFEQMVFGFRPDGTEGLCLPTFLANQEEVLQEDE
ncbi:CLUMA_CG010048, isoform A [Clunio marinus]|uniref:Transporter n=1 Tax=Clunio marinus TaxID=568069 RepID=A0A1J1I9A8_9DIPT|nr:CLUMA_CG010048, isoform A [Clunio marinus]